MVFENVTLFEIQLDSAEFGSRPFRGSDETSHSAHETDHETTDDEGGRSWLPMLLVAMVAIGAAVLYRRSSDSDVEIEGLDTEDDLATAQ